MSGPDNQVTGLWTQDTAEFGDSFVKVRGTRVCIRKSRTLIDGMHEVRTIGLEARTGVGFQCDAKNSQAFLTSERRGRERLRVLTCDYRTGGVRRGRGVAGLLRCRRSDRRKHEE